MAKPSARVTAATLALRTGKKPSLSPSGTLSRAAPEGYRYVRGMLVKVPAPAISSKAKPALAATTSATPSPAAPTTAAPAPELQAPAAAPTEAHAAAPERPKRREPAVHTRPVSDRLFFFVWSPQGDRPKVRHETKEGALGEADRLKTDHPGDDFFVYRAERVGRGCVRIPDIVPDVPATPELPPGATIEAPPGSELVPTGLNPVLT